MKIGKLNLKAWTYDGIELANPFLILWRLSLLPFIHGSRALLCFFAFIGWGTWQAQDMWDSTK